MQTLFWDWQAAMGGPCGMKDWQSRGWGGADGIHFTVEGYRHAADLLRDDLRKMGGI